jgi:4-carboxymuconolactone decarboxylase
MAAKKPKSKKPQSKKPAYRLPPLTESTLTPAQRGLLDALRSGPRGPRVGIDGPFGCYMHAPEAGHVIQQLAAFCRFNTRLEKRLSEFAILAIGRFWKAQYEFYVHAAEAERAGVSPKTVADLRAGRVPSKAPKDERAIYDLVSELHKTRRVSDRSYAKVQKLLGDGGVVELLAIMGSYTLTCMVLNTFNVPLPAGAVPPFAEPKV